ncbi:2-aminoethylphosphonate ABC transporter substrate-binding protein [Kitasatospora sp. NPDC002965]|uniref:2-aminoethylphosphonate ABC transporter substrate-binding protein n=1 Tax=Kitasatospora sp. NPDC002965 TaxID=3154775 RepID=UPI0033A8746B
MKELRRTTLAATVVMALAGSLAACAGSGPSAGQGSSVVTLYSADGLKSEDGKGFYDKVFKDFTAKTGVRVEYVEGGSGEIVQRLLREKSNTKADVIVTVPPFIQQAVGKGLITPYRPAGADAVPAADKDADGAWTTVVNNYLCFIHNTRRLPEPPASWNDLLDAGFRGKLQYSTPGVAGDGTAVLIKAMHDFGGIQGAADFLRKLQKNNVGPSKSTGALAAKVDKGELLVANGDVQMNYAGMKSMPNQGIFFLAGPGGKPSTFALPYAGGLVKSAPHPVSGRMLLDFLLTESVQGQVSAVAGGFPARSDVPATGDDAARLAALLKGVDVFAPDWKDIDANLKSYTDAWNRATGS